MPLVPSDPHSMWSRSYRTYVMRNSASILAMTCHVSATLIFYTVRMFEHSIDATASLYLSLRPYLPQAVHITAQEGRIQVKQSNTDRCDPIINRDTCFKHATSYRCIVTPASQLQRKCDHTLDPLPACQPFVACVPAPVSLPCTPRIALL